MPRSIYTIENNGQVYEVEANSEAEALAEIAKATAPGSGAAVYGDTQQPVTAGQERALQGMGGLDPLLPTGSGRNPRFMKPGDVAPRTGVYVDPRGSTVQIDAEPISKTILAGMSRLTGTDQWQGQQAPWAQSNTLDALQSGAMSGALLGGKNELGAIPEGLGSMFRGQGFGAGFDPALQAADERDRILRENHPYAYYGGGGLGTLATAPLTPTIRTGGAVGRTLGNAAIQGGQGAVAGALSTDGSLQDRAIGATVGAVLGGGLGAIGGRAGMPDAPRKPYTPVVEGMSESERAAAAKRLRRIVPQMPSMASVTPDMMAAEALGPAGVKELGTLARREGATGEAVTARLQQRALGRPERLLNAFEQTAGIAPDAAAGRLDNMVARGRRAAAPLYDQAFSNRAPMASETMDRLLARDAAKRGMNSARRIMSNEDVNPYTVGLTFMDDPNDWASQAGGLFPEQAAATGSRQPARAPSRGDSLATFIAKQGGLTDQGGELSVRDADRWHRAQPFRNRLVNENGLDMGDAAQRALDAGYFPELGRDGSITGADLLAAIDAELKGKPRYARELSGQAEDTLSAREAEARFGPQGQALGGDMPEYGARPMPEGGPVYEQQPTTQGVDYVIRGLDAELEKLRVNGKLPNDDLTRSIVDTRQKLRAELNRLAEDSNRNPAYVSAVREAGDYLSAKRAFTDAQKQLFNNRVPSRDFSAMVKNMTPGELMYAKAGAANAVYDLAQRGALKPNSWPPAVNAKLRSLLGDRAVDGLDEIIANEARMTATERVVPTMNGSGTFGWAETARDQDQNLLMDMARNAGIGFISAGPAGAKAGAVLPLAQRLGDVLRPGMPVKVRDAWGAALMGTPDDIASLRNVPRRRGLVDRAARAASPALVRSGRTAGVLGSQLPPRR
jgi:hypothetical protein